MNIETKVTVDWLRLKMVAGLFIENTTIINLER